MEPRFKWACSYQGCVWFKVLDDTGDYEIEMRRAAEDYERKCYNGDDADWQRNVVAMIGVLRRSHSLDKEVPAATFAAFNAWRMKEHADYVAKIAAAPERYGVDYKPEPPMLAHAAARYENGWIITASAS